MTAADARRLERILKTCGRLIDQMADAEMRGIIREWKGAGSRVSLRDDLCEFHDWWLRRLAHSSHDGEVDP